MFIINSIFMINCILNAPSSINVVSNDDIISVDVLSVDQSINQRSNEIKAKYDHVPMNPDHICYIVQLCSEYSIDPDIIFALIEIESKYDPKAKNKYSSAAGYGQLIASTAKSIAKEIDTIKSYDHRMDAYDPYINILLTIHYFSKCIDKAGGNINRALRFYRGLNDKHYINKVLHIKERIKMDKKI